MEEAALKNVETTTQTERAMSLPGDTSYFVRRNP